MPGTAGRDETSASGRVGGRPGGQRCINAISSRCPTTIRSHRARRVALASCEGAQPAISTACAWWWIMPIMKWTSAAETPATADRSEEHTSELQSRLHLVCRLLLEKKKKKMNTRTLLGSI